MCRLQQNRTLLGLLSYRRSVSFSLYNKTRFERDRMEINKHLFFVSLNKTILSPSFWLKLYKVLLTLIDLKSYSAFLQNISQTGSLRLAKVYLITFLENHFNINFVIRLAFKSQTIFCSSSTESRFKTTLSFRNGIKYFQLSAFSFQYFNYNRDNIFYEIAAVLPLFT